MVFGTSAGARMVEIVVSNPELLEEPPEPAAELAAEASPVTTTLAFDTTVVGVASSGWAID